MNELRIGCEINESLFYNKILFKWFYFNNWLRIIFYKNLNFVVCKKSLLFLFVLL